MYPRCENCEREARKVFRYRSLFVCARCLPEVSTEPCEGCRYKTRLEESDWSGRYLCEDCRDSEHEEARGYWRTIGYGNDYE